MNDFKDIIIFHSPGIEDETDPCVPSPCGPNSQCRVVSGNPVCSCLPEYTGSPPSCRPECVVSSDCPSNRACVNQKCVNPCPRPCGQNTNCLVVNHSPICTCKDGNTGNPFTRCFPLPRKFSLMKFQSAIKHAVNYTINRFYSSINVTWSTSKPLRTIPLRSVLGMSGYRWCTILFLFS